MKLLNNPKQQGKNNKTLKENRQQKIQVFRKKADFLSYSDYSKDILSKLIIFRFVY